MWTGHRLLGYARRGVSLVAILLTLYTLHGDQCDGVPGELRQAPAVPWQDLGYRWLAAVDRAFSAGAGGARRRRAGARSGHGGGGAARSAPESRAGCTRSAASTTMLSVALFGVGLALFYPPTATSFWQQALVTDIGVYVLLAIGLNVVIGWAGLLDLGYIAFYALGSYTTAYFTGSLPVQPPSWLLLSPLWAIPVAIVVCLIAGVILGGPTLRLRGDYLAIVTLGFGEIIRITAVNNPGNFTNGPRGVADRCPHPVINLGFFRIEWGGNQLQYWYLLLVLVALVFVLFYRLEGSRLGRAWAAIREDEVAAQASGVNTTRVKLLAFAIGASTSGLAGVFFASDIGYFNPQNFVLNNSILVVAYVVFGGMGSLAGAIAGAAVLTWLPDFLRDQVPSEDRHHVDRCRPDDHDDLPAAGPDPGHAGARPSSTGLAGHDTPSGRACRRSRPGKGCDAMTQPTTQATAAAAPEDLVFDVQHITLAVRRGDQPGRRQSLQMRRGEILAVIGPNGAGKTSLFNSLTGVYTPQEGEIMLPARPGDAPVSVLGQKTHVVNHLGVARTFQNIRLFPALTALENVKVGHRDAAEVRPDRRDARPALAAPRGAGEHRDRLRAARPGGAGPPGQRARRLAALRRAAPAGDRPRAGHEPRRPPAGRACRGHQPGGEAGARRADQAGERATASACC